MPETFCMQQFGGHGVGSDELPQLPQARGRMSGWVLGPRTSQQVWRDLTAPLQGRAEHVASRGGKSSLSNEPIFPQPPCLSQQQNTAKNLKLPQVEHACCWLHMNGFAWKYVDSRKTYVAAPAAETLICMRFFVASFIDVEFESAYYVLTKRESRRASVSVHLPRKTLRSPIQIFLARTASPHNHTKPFIWSHLAYSCSRRGLWCVLINTLLLRARPQQKHQQDSTSVYHSFYIINIYCLPVRSK